VVQATSRGHGVERHYPSYYPASLFAGVRNKKGPPPPRFFFPEKKTPPLPKKTPGGYLWDYSLGIGIKDDNASDELPGVASGYKVLPGDDQSAAAEIANGSRGQALGWHAISKPAGDAGLAA